MKQPVEANPCCWEVPSPSAPEVRDLHVKGRMRLGVKKVQNYFDSPKSPRRQRLY